MLSALQSWLWGNPQFDQVDASRPAIHQFFPADEPRPDDQRRYFDGTVLTYTPEGGTITGDIWFDPDTVRGPRRPQVGENVHGEARRRNEDQAWIAICVEISDDDWTTDDRRPAEKRVVGQVARFEGELLLLKDRETEYRLHRSGVDVDFMPQEGDWLELESDSDIPLEVSSESSAVQVRPLRRWQLDGEVTFVAHEPPVFGIIDNQIYFYSAAWALPRMPRRGDKVRCSAVESSQTTPKGITLNWRAVRVAALEARAWLQQPTPVATPAPSAALELLLQDKRGVTIRGDGDFGHLKCGERRRVALAVRNSGLDPVTLRSGRIMSDSAGQFGVTIDSDTEIPAGRDVSVTIDCRAVLVGGGRALCVLDFSEFQIGHWLSVHVEDPDMHRLKVTAPGRRQRHAALMTSDLDAREGCVVVPGRPAFKPAPFVSARLPPYPLPTRLLSMDGDGLLANYPCLADPLTAQNYRQRLDLLLYIEEVEMIRAIRQYDMTGVAMTRAGEHLQLTVPGLAESRPSLVVGDKALLSHPSEMNGVKYEGHIHEVRHSSLLLAFHPDFQARYSGQEYNAQFEFSRSQMRQLHRAVETALARLGGDLLFPDRAPTRLPQVTFIEELCWSPEPSVCSHNKRVSFDLSDRGPTPAAGETPPTGDDVGNSLGSDVTEEAESERTPTNSSWYPAAISEENAVSSVANLDTGTTPTNSPRHDASMVEEETQTSGLPSDTKKERMPKNSMNGLVTSPGTVQRQLSLDSQSDVSSPHDPPHRNATNDFDTQSITSDSDLSFVSADCSLDESQCVSASCTSLSESTDGKGRTRRRRRLAVVDRLFNSPPQRRGDVMCSKAGGDATTCTVPVVTSPVSRHGVMNGPNGQMDCDRNSGVVEIGIPVLRRNGITDCSRRLSAANSAGYVTDLATSTVISDHPKLNPATTASSPPSTTNPVSESSSTPAAVSNPPVPSARSPSPKPLSSPLKAPSLSRAASDLRRRALSAVGSSGSSSKKTPFVVPRFTAVAPAGGVAPPRDAAFVVPRMAAEVGGVEKRGVRLLRWFNPRLNGRQRAAVRRVLKGLARPLPYIIYGPPGSGKTVTVVECILQTYTMLPNSRILVATPSNSAADLITERLHLSGALHKAALVRLTSFNRSEESCPEVVQPYVMSGDSLEAASRRRIIVGTAGAVGNLYRLGLRQGHFTHVFVDEAGHMTEPEALVPLGLVSALDGQAVLAGDPQQLGPVLQSRYAAAWGMQTSMLERLSERSLYSRDEQRYADHGCYNPLLVTKLVNNYRSHRELISVPSRLYYHSELVPCADSELINKWCHLSWLPKPGFPLLFHGVRGENVQEGDSPSWFNPTEAFQVIRYLQKLGSAGVDWDEVGVISPYRKQTEKIRQLIDTFALPMVKVGSVEEFQGQEREVIILTTVRSSEVTLSHDVVYRLGFMQNRRRFNVAVTRAKCLLIVVGNPHLLAADDNWRHLVVHAVTNGAAIGCDGVL